MPSDIPQPTFSPALTRAAVIAAARSFVGTPFRHQGRSAQGVDCVGLLVCIARALNLPHDDVTGYTRRAEGMGFLEHFRGQLVEISLASACAGDVLVFVETVYPCHTALLTERHGIPHLIHAHAPRRKIIEEPYATAWQAKARFAFRFPQLIED